MNNFKKSALVAAMVMGMGTGAAHAFPIATFSFNGAFDMYTGAGALVDSGNGVYDPSTYSTPATSADPVTGTMVFDFGTGTGTATMTPGAMFQGAWWTANAITMQMIGQDPNTGVATVRASMMFGWGSSTGIPVVVDFSMTPMNQQGSVMQIATLDCAGTGAMALPCDGVLGYGMTTDPFLGFNATFSGIATMTSYDPGTVVPVPAAVWLLGSGLLGLVGVARRKVSFA